MGIYGIFLSVGSADLYHQLYQGLRGEGVLGAFGFRVRDTEQTLKGVLSCVGIFPGSKEDDKGFPTCSVCGFGGIGVSLKAEGLGLS